MSWYTAPETHPHYRHGWRWKRSSEGLLCALTILVTVVTANVNLVPTLILLGSFLVPVCVLLFVIERVTGLISTPQVVLAIFVGGICGVLGASLLELNLNHAAGMFVAVGFIEDVCQSGGSGSCRPPRRTQQR